MNLANELQTNFSEYKFKIEHNKKSSLLYSEDKKCRYYYYYKLKNLKINKKVTVIMINPSESDFHIENETPDNTINNLYNIINNKFNEISAFEVLNLYPLINSKFDGVINQDICRLNLAIIEYVIQRANIVIPAWGVEKKYNRDMTKIIKEIKNMCKTKEVKIIVNKFPCHFSVQCTSLNRNPELVTYNF